MHRYGLILALGCSLAAVERGTAQLPSGTPPAPLPGGIAVSDMPPRPVPRVTMGTPSVLPIAAKVPAVREGPVPVAPDVSDLEQMMAKLKAARDALAAEQISSKQQFSQGIGQEAAESTKLRPHLDQLIRKLGSPDAVPKILDLQPSLPLPTVGKEGGTKVPSPLSKQPADPKPAPIAVKEPPESDAGTDPLALAHVLFKSGKWDLALKAYRLINTTGMRPDERAPLQYLTATCLRNLGKWDEAAALYREVANTRGDEQVAACAQWQLVQLRWRKDIEGELKELRERRKALEGKS